VTPAPPDWRLGLGRPISPVSLAFRISAVNICLAGRIAVWSRFPVGKSDMALPVSVNLGPLLLVA